VSVISAGPSAREDEALQHCLARGANRALRVYDDSLAGVDFYALAKVLGAVVKHAGFDLILAGDRSEDEAQGAVGPAVAESLAIPHLTAALDLKLEDGAAVITRRDRGQLRTLKLGLPALVTVTRYDGGVAPGVTEGDARGDSDKQEEHAQIEALDLEAIGLAAAELKHRDRCLGRPTPVRVARNATVVAEADDLLARLREDHLLGG
jgi:electron transfer flavoprotein beta subunit